MSSGVARWRSSASTCAKAHIDVKQYLTALKFKWIFRIFNENFVADWKTIENICLKENLLFCVLRSNCKFSSTV